VLLVGEDDIKADAAGSVNGEGLDLATLVQPIVDFFRSPGMSRLGNSIQSSGRETE
jgi:hypothetical protein